MVMADDALFEEEVSGVGWGGPRAKTWHKVGKRAVVHISPQAYQVVSILASLCSRPMKDFHAQVYAAGLESLVGQSFQTISDHNYTVTKGPRPLTKALTHDQVREMASRITFTPPEGGE